MMRETALEGRARRDREARARLAAEGVDLSKPLPGTPRTAARCGTPAGYQKHRRDKTAACDPCREANNEYAREGYQRRRAAG